MIVHFCGICSLWLFRLLLYYIFCNPGDCYFSLLGLTASLLSWKGINMCASWSDQQFVSFCLMWLLYAHWSRSTLAGFSVVFLAFLFFQYMPLCVEIHVTRLKWLKLNKCTQIVSVFAILRDNSGARSKQKLRNQRNCALSLMVYNCLRLGRRHCFYTPRTNLTVLNAI